MPLKIGSKALALILLIGGAGCGYEQHSVSEIHYRAKLLPADVVETYGDWPPDQHVFGNPIGKCDGKSDECFDAAR